MSQFYVILQEIHETMPQFIIRFQNLRRQLAQQLPEDDVKEGNPFGRLSQCSISKDNH